MAISLPTHRVHVLANILGEFSEIARSGGDATGHVANSILRLIGADAGGLVLAPSAQSQPGDNMIDASLAGFSLSEMSDIQTFYSEHTLLDMAATAMVKVDSMGTGCCRLRRELVSDRDWYDSEFVSQYRRQWRIDDSIYGGLKARGGNFAGIACFRAWGSKPFTEEDRDLLQAIALGCNGRVFERTAVVHLSRRQKQILDCLLMGASAKQIAARLGLSIHTTNEYIQVVYRAYDVNTKAALLARVLQPAQQPASRALTP
jgi:DNA-binding CsgD family transcriptional regulator